MALHFKEILEALKKVSLFKDFADDEEAIKKIAGICKERSYKKNTAIIKEGEKGDELFILIKGDVNIIKKTLQNEEYTVVTLKGEWGDVFVGEQGLLDEDRRSATVETVTPCTFLIITREDFMTFGDENPVLGLKITRVIAKKLSTNLRKTNKDIITLFSALVDEVADEHLK